MTSKKASAKEFQGYQDHTVPSVCGNCAHRNFKIKRRETLYKIHETETCNQCGIGGFAVKKTGSCNLFEMKAD